VARDHFHGAVRRALEKGGWTITADPYLVRFDRTTVEIDLAAEQLLAAERAARKIAVEVKSFLGPSADIRFPPGSRTVPHLPDGN
jgi:hypothetical protein